MDIRTISNLVVLSLFLFFNFAYAEDILINEIAWMGTETSANDEWIELYNPSSSDISLENYILLLGEKEIPLKGTIKANGFFILERTDETTLPQIKADLIYTGSMKNTGMKISLKEEVLIDEVNFENGWTVGDNTTKQTAERTESGWQTSSLVGGSPLAKNTSPKKTSSLKEVPSQTFPSKKVIQENLSTIKEIEKRKTDFPLDTVLGLSLFSATTLVFIRKQVVKK